MSVLALGAFAQPRRICKQTHQGGEPHARFLAPLVCKTLNSRCHGQSPLSVGPCATRTFAQAATSLLGTHSQASTLLCVAPTSEHLRPCPRSDNCARVPASCGPTLGSPWLPRALNVRLDATSDPGEYPGCSPVRSMRCCLTGDKSVGTPNHLYGAQHFQGRLLPVTFAPRPLSCLRIDALATSRFARLDTGLVANDYPDGIPIH